MLKGLRLRFPTSEIEKAYLADRYQEKKTYRRTLNYFFAIAATLIIINDVFYLVWGDLDLWEFILRACGFFTICCAFCILANVARLRNWLRRVPFWIHESVLCFLASSLVLAILGITLESATHAKKSDDALFFGINIFLEVIWFILFIMFFFANWRLKALLYGGIWVLVFVDSARRKDLTVGDYVFYFRILVLQTMVFYLQEKSTRDSFARKHTANQNSESLKSVLSQVHSNIIIRTLQGEIKHANMHELETLTGTGISSRVLDNERSFEFSPTIRSNKFLPFILETIQKLELRRRDKMLVRYPNIAQILPSCDTLQKLLELIAQDRKLFDDLDSRGHLALRGLVTMSPTKKHYLEINLSRTVLDQQDCLVITIQDVTESVNHLQQINDLQLNLLSSISHELRTPLNHNINLLDQIIESKEAPRSLIERFILPALNQAKILSYFINDVLDYQQIQREDFKITPWNDTSTHIIEECTNLFSSAIASKKLQFYVEHDKDHHSVDFTTDHTRVKQILLNLLSNALKYTINGSITLKYQYSAADQSVTFSVKDTGIGMTAEELRILKHMISNSTFAQKVNSNSTGGALGLTISNKISQHLNNQNKGIQITAEKNKGSEFAFTVSNQLVKRAEENIIEMLKSMEDIDELAVRPQFKLSFQNSRKKSLMMLASVSHRNSNRKASTIPHIYFNDDLHLKAKQPYLTRASRTLTQKYTDGNTNTFRSLLDEQTNKQIENLIVSSPINYEKTGDVNDINDINEIKCKCASILIVDDDIFNIMALEMILQSLNLTCDKAYHGHEALEKLRMRAENLCSENCRQYSLILMDCNMPIMNGYEATKIICEKIRNEEWEEVPIIGCTAYEGKERLDGCLEAGMKSYIKKPVDRKKLQDEIIKKYLRGLRLE